MSFIHLQYLFWRAIEVGAEPRLIILLAAVALLLFAGRADEMPSARASVQLISADATVDLVDAAARDSGVLRFAASLSSHVHSAALGAA